MQLPWVRSHCLGIHLIYSQPFGLFPELREQAVSLHSPKACIWYGFKECSIRSLSFRWLSIGGPASASTKVKYSQIIRTGVPSEKDSFIRSISTAVTPSFNRCRMTIWWLPYSPRQKSQSQVARLVVRSGFFPSTIAVGAAYFIAVITASGRMLRGGSIWRLAIGHFAIIAARG